MNKSLKRFKWVNRIMTVSHVVLIAVFIFALVMSITMSFAAEESFVIREKNPYQIANNFGNTPHFLTEIKSKHINGTTSKVEEYPKQAVLIKIYSHALPLYIMVYLCFYLLRKVIKDFTQNVRFKMKHVRYFRIMSGIVLVYFLLGDVFVEAVYNIWKGWGTISFDNIHFSGFLFAGLIYAFSEILNHGVYLQEAYDTTL